MKRLILFFTFFLGIYTATYSQIGACISLIAPRGDMGAVFKKSLSYELSYYFSYYGDDRMHTTIGVSFTSLVPRADSFPSFQDGKGNSGGGNSIFPQMTVYEPMKNYAFYIDNSFRIFNIRKFSFYVGARLTIGLSKSSLTTYGKYDPSYVSVEAHDNDYGGFGASLQGVYAFDPHFHIAAIVGHNALVAPDWSYTFSHHFLSLGVNYIFKTDQ
jgi:hypothetical protein